MTLSETIENIHAICDGITDEIALMATISCELYQHIDGFDWVGFYRVTAPDMLHVGPYQGGHGCLSIPFDKGVCGAAARTRSPQLVPDVNAFPGHIACASSTQSELVLPVFTADNQLIAVLDIDSDQPDFFTAQHQSVLTAMLQQIFGT